MHQHAAPTEGWLHAASPRAALVMLSLLFVWKLSTSRTSRAVQGFHLNRECVSKGKDGELDISRKECLDGISLATPLQLMAKR